MQARFETRKIVRTQSLGEILRRRRLEKGYHLDDVAKKTMLLPQYIEYLEKDEHDKLPARVYVEGFLKKIADALQLDDRSLIRMYRKEQNIKENIEKKHTKPTVKPFRNPKLYLSPTIIRNTIISLVILFGVGYLWYQISSLSKAPTLALVEPGGDQEVQEDELVVVGHVDPNSTLSINGQSVFVAQSGDFRETVSLQPGSNSIEIRAANKLGKETVVTRQIYSEQPTAVAVKPSGPVETRTDAAVDGASTSKKTEEKKKTEDVELKIDIVDLATWIQVEVDGKMEFSGTMLPGSSKLFTGKEYISLTSGKAHKTLVTFNGQSLGALSSEGGVVRDLRFDKDLNVSELGL